ncbi:MAG: ABC transporter substrate-binding protein [Oleiphilaceae bacterium]|nr:ABC transporter substrate-binding protein [Oleiphilaceae bacterium]
MTLVLRQLAVLGLLAMLVVGQVAAADSGIDSEQDLRRYVDENTQQMVKLLNENRGLYEEDPEAFYEELEDAMTGFVDFRRIAARVMGRYARQASPEQRDEFVRVFKRSLFDSYAKMLVSADDFEMAVQEVDIKSDNADRALVSINVTTEGGDRYPVTYSMYRNKEGKWLMENVIVEGVNIGLAYRDRFAQNMDSERGDVDAVIDGWVETVQEIDLDEEKAN